MKFFLFISLIIINYIKGENEEIKKNITEELNKLNVTIDEMDQMMLCSVFVQEALRKDKDRIEALANKTNMTKNPVFEKVGADIFDNCYKSIDMPTVRKYFKNLTYLGGYEWKTEFNKYIEIDYDKYLETKFFNLTQNQIILAQKFTLVKEQFKQKQAEDREKLEEEQNRLKIGNIDLENIPSNIKGVIFIIVFAIIFGGSVFLLKTLVNKPKKKKEKKKKNQ